MIDVVLLNGLGLEIDRRTVSSREEMYEVIKEWSLTLEPGDTIQIEKTVEVGE